MPTKRLGRIEYYMKIAQVVSERSTCTRAKVGAVLVNPLTNRVVAMGYNGSVKGSPHCIDEGCLMHKDHCIRTIHAELNAILNLEKEYKELHLYCTHQPCIHCTKALIGANVTLVFYNTPYLDEGRDLLLRELNTVNYRRLIMTPIGTF